MLLEVKDIDGNNIGSTVGLIEKINVSKLEVENCMDVNLNEELTLHITHSPDGYIIDLYKHYTEEELEDEDHDFDEDFVDSICVYNDQLKK